MVQGDYDEYIKDYPHLKVKEYLKIVRERERRELQRKQLMEEVKEIKVFTSPLLYRFARSDTFRRAVMF